MGNGDSKQEARLKVAISKVNKVELKDLEAVFQELSTKTNDGQDVIYQPTWLNRDKFAQVLGTNEFLIEVHYNSKLWVNKKLSDCLFTFVRRSLTLTLE